MSRHGIYDLKYGFIPDDDCPEPQKPQTNADLVRAYADERLAELFNQIETEGKAYGPRGKKAWLDWLKRENTNES